MRTPSRPVLALALLLSATGLGVGLQLPDTPDAHAAVYDHISLDTLPATVLAGKAVKVGGSVRLPDGRLAVGYPVTPYAVDGPTGAVVWGKSTTVGKDGRFSVSVVFSGQHVGHAVAVPFAAEDGGDLAVAPLPRPALTFPVTLSAKVDKATGEVQLKGTSAGCDLVVVQLLPHQEEVAQATCSPSGTFGTSTAVPPGETATFQALRPGDGEVVADSRSKAVKVKVPAPKE